MISADIQQLTSDPNVINGFRSVSIGLGKFFDELYPRSSLKPLRTNQRFRASSAIDAIA